MSLHRNSIPHPDAAMSFCIDDLTMNYGSSNQLRNINDSGINDLKNPSDFKDYKKGSAEEYFYNANGAMTRDLNKGISEIQYDRLNLPKRIDIINPVAEARNEYTYTTAGVKLSVVHRWNPAYSNTPVTGSAVNAGSLTEKITFDYAGNKIYKNGVLEKILTENGYYENGKYYFYIRDHLGNNRLVADQTGNVEQSTQYYPFGMIITETNREKHAFKFGGKDLDVMNSLNLYDFVAREYDPVTGRYLTPDPLAEKYYSVSPYAYCLNNPVRLIDPDGRDPKNPKHWVRFASDMYKATTVAVTVGLQVAGEIKLNNVGVGGDVNLISTDAIGVRDGKFTPGKDAPQIRQGIEIEVGVAGIELSKSITDNGNSTVTVQETKSASVLCFEASSETTTIKRETKSGDYVNVSKPTTENSIKTSDLNVKAAVGLGVEINLGIEKAWNALKKLLTE
jgi:RHS repeat-associated protein